MSSDWLSVIWHTYREEKKAAKAAVVSLLLGLIGWISIIWIVDTSYYLMIPDLAGNIVGSYFGIRFSGAPLPIAIWLGFKKKEDKE